MVAVQFLTRGEGNASAQGLSPADRTQQVLISIGDYGLVNSFSDQVERTRGAPCHLSVLRLNPRPRENGPVHLQSCYVTPLERQSNVSLPKTIFVQAIAHLALGPLNLSRFRMPQGALRNFGEVPSVTCLNDPPRVDKINSCSEPHGDHSPEGQLIIARYRRAEN